MRNLGAGETRLTISDELASGHKKDLPQWSSSERVPCPTLDLKSLTRRISDRFRTPHLAPTGFLPLLIGRLQGLVYVLCKIRGKDGQMMFTEELHITPDPLRIR